MITPQDAFFVSAKEGKSFHVITDTMTIKVPSERVNGAYSVTEDDSSIAKMQHLFGMNSFIDQESKIMKHAYSAQLHGNMTAYNMFNNQDGILICIDNTLLSHSENDTVSQEMDTQAASGCDGTVTYALVSHSIGNNQTILNWAHLYLKARGIQ